MHTGVCMSGSHSPLPPVTSTGAPRTRRCRQLSYLTPSATISQDSPLFSGCALSSAIARSVRTFARPHRLSRLRPPPLVRPPPCACRCRFAARSPRAFQRYRVVRVVRFAAAAAAAAYCCPPLMLMVMMPMKKNMGGGVVAVAVIDEGVEDGDEDAMKENRRRSMLPRAAAAAVDDDEQEDVAAAADATMP